MKPEFEEKTFESYFNSELDRKSSMYFPFGQVQEGSIGLDSSSNTRNRRLWRFLGHPFWFFPPFSGVELREVASEMESFLGHEIKHIPQIKVNLLIQYKRPEYITTAKGGEWQHWNQKYFRYDIYQKQQELLERLENVFRENAIVIYASPALYTLDELLAAKRTDRIIENSNFTRAYLLSNHHKNTYITAGRYSIACSEYEKTNSLNLLNTLEEVLQKKEYNNKKFIINTAQKAKTAVLESSFYSKVFGEFEEKQYLKGEYPLLNSFLTMRNINELTGIQWLLNTVDSKE